MIFKFGSCLVKSKPIFSSACENNISYVRNSLRKLIYYSTAVLSDKDLTSSCSDEWKKKIIYNEILHFENKARRYKVRDEKSAFIKQLDTSDAVPMGKSLFLKCMDNDSEKQINHDEHLSVESVVQFPYVSHKNVLIDGNSSENVEADIVVEKVVEFDTQLKRIHKGKIEYENPQRWTNEEDDFIYEDPNYGSADPNIPISNVPCGGCGALLHCKDTGIPGFVPKEIFIDLSESDLRGITCQRCFFLEEYNIALGINVNPNEYPKILSQIKDKVALVLLLVDILDFPCSIWPNIINIIGKNRPIFLVVNKMDLILEDNNKNFKKHRMMCVMKALEDINIDSKQIKHVALISAKTGYGVEKLITEIQNFWGTTGDIYIVGCTNAGKSTLFNSLIQSDLCKIKASDILQRATVSQWPGTTLNLLKFPLLKPLSWRKAVRSQRLKVTEQQMKAYRQLQASVLRSGKISRQVSLMGYIGKSFEKQQQSDMIGLDPNDPDFKHSKWCYDTPGVVSETQILNLLTTEELAKVLPQRTIVPRNFKLISGNALFIAGIARLDIISTNTYVWCTVFASAELPVTITNVEDADALYEKLLGSNLFAVPCGVEKRLKEWPKLMSKNITVVGVHKDVAAADVVLSSAGWVAITTDPARACELCAWTPDRRGIFVREPGLIKYSSCYRDSKIRGTPAYYPSIEIVDNSDFAV